MLSVDVTSIVDGGSTIARGSISIDGNGNTGSWEVTSIGTPGNVNTHQNALPVELSLFSATTIGSTVRLSWQTATEVNNYGFEIERYALKR